MRRLFLWVIGVALTTTSYAWTAEARPEGLDCLNRVRTVCVGLGESMGRCLSERGAQFNPECRKMLESYTSVAQTQRGPAICVPDVQKACPNLPTPDLYACIHEKKPTFSQACQTFLDTTPELNFHHHPH